MATQKEGDSAKNPDQSVIYMQRQIAKLKALRAIHRWLDVNVDFYSYGMLKDRVRFKSYAHHSASDLENTEIEDEWLDEKTGDLYIWLVISKKNSLR
ncbi:MAG: hypothetical protein LBP51_07145 [Deferribacteraceae bacterium]|nr:hypothetical protein [Deferribacteraceae bacterium]